MSSSTSSSEPFRTHLRWVAGLTLAGLSGVAALNWTMDPFSIFQAPLVKGLNEDKPEFVNHLRMTKVRMIEARQPTQLIVGTSRAGLGLSGRHPAWGDEGAYNVAAPSLDIYEMYRFVQHAHAVRRLERVVLAVDYRTFMRVEGAPGFSDARLKVNADGSTNPGYALERAREVWASLTSIDTLRASLRNLRKQGWEAYRLRDDGSWVRKSGAAGPERAFGSSVRDSCGLLREFAGRPREAIALDYFRRLLALAHREAIDLRIIISPSHAWHWETFHDQGLWADLERLKVELVEANEAQAAQHRRPPLPLWDFAGYDGISTEEVPIGRGALGQMQWFSDALHYSTRAGDLVLNKVLKEPDSAMTAAPTEFGVRISAANIAERLLQTRQAREAYLQQHQADRDEIRKYCPR